MPTHGVDGHAPDEERGSMSDETPTRVRNASVFRTVASLHPEGPHERVELGEKVRVGGCAGVQTQA